MSEWEVISHFNAVFGGEWVLGLYEVEDLDLNFSLREVLVVVLYHFQSHRRFVLLVVQALEDLTE